MYKHLNPFHKSHKDGMPIVSRLLQMGNIQDEHKVFSRLQTLITRKLRGIQTYFLKCN